MADNSRETCTHARTHFSCARQMSASSAPTVSTIVRAGLPWSCAYSMACAVCLKTTSLYIYTFLNFLLVRAPALAPVFSLGRVRLAAVHVRRDLQRSKK